MPQYSPNQIGALVLTTMKEIAGDYLGKFTSKVVIIVPALMMCSDKP